MLIVIRSIFISPTKNHRNDREKAILARQLKGIRIPRSLDTGHNIATRFMAELRDRLQIRILA